VSSTAKSFEEFQKVLSLWWMADRVKKYFLFRLWCLTEEYVLFYNFTRRCQEEFWLVEMSVGSVEDFQFQNSKEKEKEKEVGVCCSCPVHVLSFFCQSGARGGGDSEILLIPSARHNRAEEQEVR